MEEDLHRDQLRDSESSIVDHSVNRGTEENFTKRNPESPHRIRRRLATLASEPGVSVARLAMEHGVITNLLFNILVTVRLRSAQPPGT